MNLSLPVVKGEQGNQQRKPKREKKKSKNTKVKQIQKRLATKAESSTARRLVVWRKKPPGRFRKKGKRKNPRKLQLNMLHGDVVPPHP